VNAAFGFYRVLSYGNGLFSHHDHQFLTLGWQLVAKAVSGGITVVGDFGLLYQTKDTPFALVQVNHVLELLIHALLLGRCPASF
jgi:hypothetical protein